jgi:putative flavoprotein involved in K+ transport
LPGIGVADYRDPASLPPGDVLVVGSGQSGAQIAEELHQAGRRVYLLCGRAPWAPRWLAGHDLLWWLVESGFMDQAAESLPSPAARLISNPLATGHGGGHDLDLRPLRAMGVTLTGRFLGANGRQAQFAPDLAESVAWGDARYRELMVAFRKTAVERGCEVPQIADPGPFDPSTPGRIDLSGFGAPIFTGGIRPDYDSWLPLPDAFDGLGFPLQRDGESTAVPGLFFIGVHFLRKRKSALLMGVGEDATVVAGRILLRRRLAS